MLRDFLERWLQFAVCKFLTNTPQQKKTTQIIQKAARGEGEAIS